MKKSISLIVVIIIVLSTCSCDFSLDAFTTANNEEIVANEKYFKIIHGDLTQTKYEIYDNSGKIVVFGETERPLSIKMLDDITVDIAEGYGTGITCHTYYNTTKNMLSNEFFYVLAVYGENVAYINVPTNNSFNNRKIIVQNMFDANNILGEFSLPYSQIDNPVVSAFFSKDGKKLNVTYMLSNHEEADVTIVLTTT